MYVQHIQQDDRILSHYRSRSLVYKSITESPRMFSLSSRDLLDRFTSPEIGVVHPPRRWTGSLKKCKCNRCPGERARLTLAGWLTGWAKRSVRLHVEPPICQATVLRSHQLQCAYRIAWHFSCQHHRCCTALRFFFFFFLQRFSPLTPFMQSTYASRE